MGDAQDHSPHPARVFFSYAPADRKLRDALIKHLALMKREGLLRAWYDEMITPGTPWREELERELDAADLILLLVSADYNASDECFEREMRRALERREQGQAKVIPIILRPCDWESAPFAELPSVLPSNREPVTRWKDHDAAFLDVARGIRRALGAKDDAPAAAAGGAKAKLWQMAAVVAALLMAGGGVVWRWKASPTGPAIPVALAASGSASDAALAAVPPSSASVTVHPFTAATAPSAPAAVSAPAMRVSPTMTPPQVASQDCPPPASGQKVVCTGDLQASYGSKVKVANQEGGGSLDARTGKIKVGDNSQVSVGNRTSAPADASTRVQTKDVAAGDGSTIEIGNTTR